MLPVLRDYQCKVIDALRGAYARGRRAPLLVMPTGSGKTLTFSFMAKSAAERGRKVCIIVHRRELLRQASEALTRMGVEHGRIATGEPETQHAVQVASVQSLLRRLDRFYFNFLIIDEAHHAVANSWRRISREYEHAQLLGVTASPVRGNGMGLGECFDELIEGPTVRELILRGHLVEPHVYAPPTQIDLTGVSRRMGDYEQAELERRLNKPTITGSAVEHYLRLCKGQPAVAFCVGLAHAEAVAEQFRAAGVRAQRIDGSLAPDARDRAIAGLASGDIDLLTSVDLIGEGLDLPNVSAALLLRPTQSTGLFIQQVGRALRPAPNKSHAVILDHVGACLQHGMPEQDRVWSLTSPRRPLRLKDDEDEGPDLNIHQCAKCYTVFEGAGAACPRCGAIVPVKKRKIRQASGELERLTAEDVKRQHEAARKLLVEEEMQCSSLQELTRLAKSRGFAPGWAYHRWPVIRMGRAAKYKKQKVGS